MQLDRGSAWCLMSFGPLSPLAGVSCLVMCLQKSHSGRAASVGVLWSASASPAESLGEKNKLETLNLAGQHLLHTAHWSCAATV